MKKHLHIALFIFLIPALCSLNVQKAQASDEIPKKIQRNWAEPDCGNYEAGVVLSKYFYLKSTETDLTLMPVTLGHEEDDYWVLDMAGAKVPARLENDAILKIGSPAKDNPARAKDWEDLKLDDTEEYTGCLDTPGIVPKVMQRLIRFADRIKDQCTVSVTNECAGVLFKLADENSDKRLSAVEIRRAVSSALLFAELAERKTLTSKDATQLIADTTPDAQQVADTLLKEYDKDKSGSLDYNEIMGNFHAPDLPVIKQALEKTGKLIPAFSLVAMTMK